jgi:hypothetical protein
MYTAHPSPHLKQLSLYLCRGQPDENETRTSPGPETVTESKPKIADRYAAIR